MPRTFPSDAPPDRSRIEADFQEVYEKHHEFLHSIAVRKFGVPPDEAEALVHDVFLSFRERTGEIYDIHAWLLGGICHASRYYWRQQGRGGERVDLEEAMEEEEPASRNIRDDLPDAVAVREAIDFLPPRYRDVVRLRFYDGHSIADIAAKLGITAQAAQKLVERSVKKMAKVYFAPNKKLTADERDLQHVVREFVEPYRKAG